MKISEEKVKRMILYFAQNTDASLLGKTKLMKLFYFTDFRHVKKYLVPVTNDNYVNLEHGPVPSAIMNMIGTVENEIDTSVLGDAITVVERAGSNMKQIAARRPFTEKDAEHFTKSELAVMSEVCEIFNESTGKQIEDASHSEAAWMRTKRGQFIPYSLGTNDPDSLVSQEDVDTALSMFS